MGPLTAKLCHLPKDVLYHIVVHLYDSGASLRPFAESCQTLYRIYNTLRHGSEYAIPMTLPLPKTIPAGLSVTPSAGSKLTINKTNVPGDAYIVFPRDVTQMCTIWHFRLDVFQGHRIEIGIATADAFRFGLVEQASSWSFDCFGRVCLAGRRRTYGRQMRQGDVVGVVYDAGQQTISFLDDGVSMGTCAIESSSQGLKLGNGKGKGKALLPFVYFPYRCGETISTTRSVERCIVDLKHVHASVKKWRRQPHDLPFDGCVIVQTWEERTWYAVRTDPRTTSLASFWKELESRHGVAMHLFELIFNGKRLQNRHDVTLAEAGIVIDGNSGTCCSDVLLSVPHIVS